MNTAKTKTVHQIIDAEPTPNELILTIPYKGFLVGLFCVILGSSILGSVAGAFIQPVAQLAVTAWLLGF